MKDKIISFLKRYLPFLCVLLFDLRYRYTSRCKLSTKKDKLFFQKALLFLKAGFYDFYLEPIKFKIYLDPDNGYVDERIFCFGNYEPTILRLIANNLSSDSIFLDIGANIGQHGLYASYFCKKVYAFEPITKIYNQIIRSITKNNINNVQVFNIALGQKKEDDIAIYGNNRNMGGSSLFKASHQTFIQNVKIQSLDNMNQELDVDRIDLIKIDVEGFELDVLLGGRKIIERFKPKIVLEFSPCIYNIRKKECALDIYNFLKEQKYLVYDLGAYGTMMELVADFKQITLKQTNLFCIPTIS